MISPDERHELLRDLSSITYTHIRFSGLWKHLSNRQWEELSVAHAEQVVALLEQLVNERLTAIESEREEMEQWLSRT